MFPHNVPTQAQSYAYYVPRIVDGIPMHESGDKTIVFVDDDGVASLRRTHSSIVAITGLLDLLPPETVVESSPFSLAEEVIVRLMYLPYTLEDGTCLLLPVYELICKEGTGQIIQEQLIYDAVVGELMQVDGEWIPYEVWPSVDEIVMTAINSGVQSVQISKKLDLGAILTFDPEISYWGLYTVTWSSNNTTIASVNSAGVVTAKKVGMVLITATLTDPYGGTKDKLFSVMVY